MIIEFTATSAALSAGDVEITEGGVASGGGSLPPLSSEQAVIPHKHNNIILIAIKNL